MKQRQTIDPKETRTKKNLEGKKKMTERGRQKKKTRERNIRA